jgi:hypothetical protein
MSPKCIEILFQKLTWNNSIEHLNVSGNKMRGTLNKDYRCMSIMSCFKTNKKIKYLNMADCNLGDKTCEFMFLYLNS